MLPDRLRPGSLTLPLQVTIERQDGRDFCGVIRRHDGHVLRWSATVNPTPDGAHTQVCLEAGTCQPAPGDWVSLALEAICGAIVRRLTAPQPAWAPNPLS